MKKFKRYTAGVTSALLGISLLPILYLCRYVHATGDDYGYGTLTHAAWLDTHSLIEVLKAAVETVKDYYGAWQGTWWSVFFIQPAAGSFFSQCVLDRSNYYVGADNYRGDYF